MATLLCLFLSSMQSMPEVRVSLEKFNQQEPKVLTMADLNQMNHFIIFDLEILLPSAFVAK